MKEFNYINLPLGLEESISSEIASKRREKVLFGAISLGTTSIISFLALIKVGALLWQSFVQTGFYQYLSLLTSDSSILLTYWKEFTFSLVESLPFVGLISLLAILTVFVWSSARAFKNTQFILQT